MTLEGFIIGMTFAGLIIGAMWALGNVGIEKHKKSKSSFNDNAKHHY